MNNVCLHMPFVVLCLHSNNINFNFFFFAHLYLLYTCQCLAPGRGETFQISVGPIPHPGDNFCCQIEYIHYTYIHFCWFTVYIVWIKTKSVEDSEICWSYKEEEDNREEYI